MTPDPDKTPEIPDSSETNSEEAIHAMAWNLRGRPATDDEIEKSKRSADTLKQMREEDDLD